MFFVSMLNLQGELAFYIWLYNYKPYISEGFIFHALFLPKDQGFGHQIRSFCSGFGDILTLGPWCVSKMSIDMCYRV